MLIRQPLGEGFFAPGRVFPPPGRLGLVGGLRPRLKAVFTPALAFFLPRLATPVVAARALADFDLLSDLDPALALALAAKPGFAAPARATPTRLAGGLRALRRCAALRAAAVRGGIGRRRAGALAAASEARSSRAAMAALTSSTVAMPSTVLSAPLPA